MAQYADVLLPLPLPTTYTYSIPVECRHNAAVGCRVVVPLGKNKKYTALIMSLHDNCPQGYEVRPISELLDESPILLPRQMELWRWIAKYYLCTEGEADPDCPYPWLRLNDVIITEGVDLEVGKVIG